MEINVALNLPVHMKMDLDSGEVTDISLPSWLWVASEEDISAVWSDDGRPIILSSDLAEKIGEIFEQSNYPDPGWD